jgi:hypothetical protein
MLTEAALRTTLHHYRAAVRVYLKVSIYAEADVIQPDFPGRAGFASEKGLQVRRAAAGYGQPGLLSGALLASPDSYNFHLDRGLNA